MIAKSEIVHLSPYSNIDVIILANRSVFARESESDWIFGLITVGNKPILLHLLQQLESNGLHNISLACLAKDKNAYSDFIAQNPSFHITLYEVDGTATTCNIIRMIASEKKYAFVFPIDLFTSVRMTDIIDFNISLRSKITVVAAKEFIKTSEREQAPGYISNQRNPFGIRYLVYQENKPERLVTLLSDHTAITEDLDLSLKKQDLIQREESVDSMNSSDFLEQEEYDHLDIDDVYLDGNKSLIVNSTEMLTGAYVFSPECISLIKNITIADEPVHSIESELIPYLCRKVAEMEQLVSQSNDFRNPPVDVSIYHVKNDDFALRIIDYELLYNANIKICGQILKNFVPAGDLVNNYYIGRDPNVSFDLKPFNVYGDNLKGPHKETNIIRSVIGNSCKLGKKVKITKSVIFDHVTIEDNVHLDNCIIAPNSSIPAGSHLRQCVVESGYNGTTPLQLEKCSVHNNNQ